MYQSSQSRLQFLAGRIDKEQDLSAFAAQRSAVDLTVPIRGEAAGTSYLEEMQSQRSALQACRVAPVVMPQTSIVGLSHTSWRPDLTEFNVHVGRASTGPVKAFGPHGLWAEILKIYNPCLYPVLPCCSSRAWVLSIWLQ